MTEDLLAFVACHEMGHHLGGAPQKPMKPWSSAEGQADYFAATKCMRKYMQEDDNVYMISQREVSPPLLVTQKCSSHFTRAREVAICQRTSLAALAMAKIAHQLRFGQGLAPHFESPDLSKVETTNYGEPSPQCRLDTAFQGALCSKGDDEDFHPAHFERGACTQSQGHEEGVRPRCWYRPPHSNLL